jgi:hypothetical protein
MLSVERSLQKPRRLLQLSVEKKSYWKRFRFIIFAFLAVLVAWVILERLHALETLDMDPLILDIGRLVALVLMILLLLRLVLAFFRWRTRPDEHIQIFDKGFVWTRNGQTFKYPWEKAGIFREGGRGIYIGKRPLFQWGAHTLTMTDGQVFKVVFYHGDMRRYARVVRPLVAAVTGTRMGRSLRSTARSITLHPKLLLWPGGVEANKEEIHWAKLDVALERNKLIIGKREKGKRKVVRKYPIHSVDNVGGFLELASSTIQNYQRERFTGTPTF